MAFDFKLSKGSATPLHEQLTNALRESVAGLAPGTRLPSENAIRRKYNLSRLTVARAFNALVGEGYLNRVQGSGTFVDNPAPLHIYFLLPCIEAVKYPGASPVMHTYAGALERAAQYGCRIETLIASPVNVPWEVNPEVIASLPRGSRLIVCGMWFRDLFATIRDCAHHVVFIDFQAEMSAKSCELIADWQKIVVDRKQMMRDIVDRLVAGGHRRIALVHNFSYYRNPNWVEYRESLLRHRLPLIPELMVFSADNELAAEHEVLHLLEFRSEYPFDAIITAGNPQAQGVARQLLRSGLTVPEDVALLSLNMTMMPASQQFAQVSLPFQDAGELAVEYFCHGLEQAPVLTGKLEMPNDVPWHILLKKQETQP